MKVSKGGLTEESGSGSEGNILGKAEEPSGMRKVGRGCVEGGFGDFGLTACGRLASNQLVNASSGKPDPFSKDGAQVGAAVDFVEGALEQGDLTFPVRSTDGGVHLMSQRLLVLSLA